MSKITLSAAPNLTGVTYYVEQPAGTFSTAYTDAAEVVIGGVHTGTYQAPEPAAYVGIQWFDGQGGTQYALSAPGGYGSGGSGVAGAAPVTPTTVSQAALSAQGQVTITIPITAYGNTNPVNVRVNDVSYTIPRNTPTAVPASVQTLLQNDGVI